MNGLLPIAYDCEDKNKQTKPAHNSTKHGSVLIKVFRAFATATRYVALPLVVTLSHNLISFAQQDSDIIFRDDFVGETLNPKWQIAGADNDRYTLIAGEYLLIVSSESGRNIFQYTDDLPADYEVILKLTTPPQHKSQVVQLSLSENNENNVRIGYYPAWFTSAYNSHGDTEIYFSKTLKGEDSHITREIGRLSEDDELYLKLRKQGVEYIGSYSVDGTTWTDVGEHIFLNLDAKPSFHVANGAEYAGYKAPESGFRFDYFEIRELTQ